MKFRDFSAKHELGINTLKSPDSSIMTTEIQCSAEFFSPEIAGDAVQFFFILSTTSPSIHKRIGLWMTERPVDLRALLVAIYKEYRSLSMSSNQHNTIVLEEGYFNISFSVTPPLVQGQTLMVWMFVS